MMNYNIKVWIQYKLARVQQKLKKSQCLFSPRVLLQKVPTWPTCVMVRIQQLIQFDLPNNNGKHSQVDIKGSIIVKLKQTYPQNKPGCEQEIYLQQ